MKKTGRVNDEGFPIWEHGTALVFKDRATNVGVNGGSVTYWAVISPDAEHVGDIYHASYRDGFETRAEAVAFIDRGDFAQMYAGRRERTRTKPQSAAARSAERRPAQPVSPSTQPRERGQVRTAEDRNVGGFTPHNMGGLTVLIRREDVRPNMIVHSSHGYRLLVMKVIDNATSRVPDRHVEIIGYLHGDPTQETRNERAPADSLVDVEIEEMP